LGLGKRNKKSFSAQNMLVLLAQLAYNLLSWIRHQLAQQHAALAQLGMLRLLRNFFSITGTLHFDHNSKLIQVVLNQANPFARLFLSLWPPGGLSLILGQI
jgi:hypothetical protein